MFRRNFFDSFMDNFFDERDRYLGTIFDRMNNMYSDLDDTYRYMLGDVEQEEEMKDEDEQPVQRIKHFESQNRRVYTDDKGRKHYYERKIENLPNEENKFKVITTKRIIPKGKSLEDVKKLPDSKKKSSLKDAKDDDFVESVSEEIKEGLPDRHLEMLDNWYGRNLLVDPLKGKQKSIEPSRKKKKEETKEETSKKQVQKGEKKSEEDRKKQIENLRKEFDQQFKDIQKQFETMKKNVFDKLNSEEMLSSKTSQV